MESIELRSSSHAMLSVFVANGIERVFLVPGESYLGLLDALGDYPEIDVVTCRHESGAGFMACADGRLTRRPGVVMVSRGPGATNASIAVHTAQQDAIPLLLVIGQIPRNDLRKEAFQEIDYQKMYGSIAKWVVEVTEPDQLAGAAFKALRIATSGTPGPVVIVIPEDIQQQPAAAPPWQAEPDVPTLPPQDTVARIARLLCAAERPLIIAGGALAAPGGRNALRALAECYGVPVALSFRRHDLFPNDHPLYAGDLGLANPAEQIRTFESSDLIMALGTRMGDITTQGYRFPQLPRPRQTFVHCYPDAHIVGLHFAADIGIVGDPVALAGALTALVGESADQAAAAGRMPAAGIVGTSADLQACRTAWASRLRGIAVLRAEWPAAATGAGAAGADTNADAAVQSSAVVRALARHAPPDVAICLDAGSFAAPVYRHFPFRFPQLLMAPISGAMGYGTPAAIATQLRRPGQKTVCMVGDGGFLMTGNEMIAAVDRDLPILFIITNNNCYDSIRIHQNREYPGRYVGTTLTNPDFVVLARAFGVEAERVVRASDIDAAIARGMAAQGPYFIEMVTSPSAPLPTATGVCR